MDDVALALGRMSAEIAALRRDNERAEEESQRGHARVREDMKNGFERLEWGLKELAKDEREKRAAIYKRIDETNERVEDAEKDIKRLDGRTAWAKTKIASSISAAITAAGGLIAAALGLRQ